VSFFHFQLSTVRTGCGILTCCYRVDDESTRYVAEENVQLLSKAELDTIGEVHERFPIEIGMWFKRYDKEAGRFVSNVKAEYPED
jgi:hypothetical protein